MTYQLSRGESKVFEHTVRSLADELVDLTDAKIYFIVRDLAGEISLDHLSVEAGGSADQIEIPDQAADAGADLGKFRLKLETDDTSDLEQAARWAECWVVTAADPPEHFKVCDHEAFYVTGNAPPNFV